MTEKEKLLLDNLNDMHEVYSKITERLHKDLLLRVAEQTDLGEKFGESIKLELNFDCEECSEEKSTKESKRSEVLKSLLNLVEETTKNKEPTEENLDKLLSDLEYVLAKQ